MSAKADMCGALANVCFGPIADIRLKPTGVKFGIAKQHDNTGRAPGRARAGAAPLPELSDQLNRYTMTHILRT
jgi:hypothetical protein